MKTEELEERLLDVERVLALQGKRLDKLDEWEVSASPQEAPIHDCSSQLEELKALLLRHDLSAQALQIYAQISTFRETITGLPKVLPIRHHHHFEDNSRGLLIGGIVCLLTVAISAGLCLSMYRENGRLQENDAKYRMMQHAYPDATVKVDSIYSQAPDETIEWLKAAN